MHGSPTMSISWPAFFVHLQLSYAIFGSIQMALLYLKNLKASDWLIGKSLFLIGHRFLYTCWYSRILSVKQCMPLENLARITKQSYLIQAKFIASGNTQDWIGPYMRLRKDISSFWAQIRSHMIKQDDMGGSTFFAILRRGTSVSLTDADCHDDMCPGNICPADNCPCYICR